MGQNPFDNSVAALDDEEKRGQAPASIYDQARQVISGQDQAQQSRLRVSLQQGDGSADQAAEDRRLALKFGIPPAAVSRDRDRWQKRERADRPYADIQHQTPATAAFAEQPENAAIVHDDLENLGFLEWVVTAPGRAFSQTMNQERYSRLRYQSMFRPLTQTEQDEMGSAKYNADLGGELGAGKSWFRKALTGTGSFLANQVPIVQYGAAGFAEGAVIGGTVGAFTGPGAVPAALATGTVTGSAGILYGVLKSTFQQESAGAYDEFSDFKDEYGNRLAPDVARAAALAAGAINAPIEAGMQELLLRYTPGLNKLSTLAVRGAVKNALRNPTVRAALFDMVKSYGTTLAGETGQEVAQRAFTILAGELAKAAIGTFQPKDPGEVTQELVDEGVAAAQSFALALVPGPSLHLAQTARKAQQAQKNVDFFTALGKGVAQSKTAQRSPDALQSFLEAATKDGPIETLYVPTDTFTQYWQDKGLDPREVAASLTGSSEAWDTARRTGEDLAIPTATYAAKLAGTEHNAFFARELKLSPIDMNAREAETWLAQQQAARQEQGAGAVNPSAEEQIAAQLTERLVAGGKYEPGTAAGVAQLVTKGITQLATAAGEDPIEVFRKYDIQINRPDLQATPASDVTPPDLVDTPPVTESARTTAQPDTTIQPTLEDLGATTGATATPEEPALPAGAEASGAPAIPPTVGRDYDAAQRQKVLEEQQQATPPDVNQPIDAMKNIGAAAARMMREDPGIIEKAERLRARAFARTEPAIVDKNVSGEETVPRAGTEQAAGAAAGQEPQGPAREQPPADTGGTEQGGGDGERAERRRLPAPGDYPLEIFRRASADEDTARLTPDVTRELERIRDELREFPFEPNVWVWQKQEENFDPNFGTAAGGKAKVIAGGAGAAVYDDILDFSPLNKAAKGEGVAKTVNGSRAAVQAAIEQTLEKGRIWNNLAEGAVRVAERRAAEDFRYINRPLLPPHWGTVASEALLADLNDAIDVALEDADISFDPSEFSQDLFDLLDAGLEVPKAVEETVDTLDTGEQQPRLPDAGQVRETHVATPAVAEAPFSLTSEVSKAQKGKQTELFQGAKPEEQIPGPVNAAGVSAVFKGWQEGAPPDIPSFPIYDILGGARDRSTVDAETLKAEGIAVPETPRKPATYFQPAYHGSPHAFEQFSLHAIGTGEGNQAYGWGLYFASQRAVADQYRENLAGQQRPRFTALTDEENRKIPDWILTRIASAIQNQFVPELGSREAGQQQLAEILKDFQKRVAEEEASLVPATQAEADEAKAKGWGTLVKAGEPRAAQPHLVRERLAALREDVRILEKLQAADAGELFHHRERPGRTFTVDVPEDDVLLDWDKPASEQPLAVQSALRNLGVEWTDFKLKSPKQLLAWFNGPTAARYAREDIGIRESLQEGYVLTINAVAEEPGSLEHLKRWQHQHQGYFNQGMVDPTGEHIYDELKSKALIEANRANRGPNGAPPFAMMPYKEGARLASASLASQGVVGIRYLDGMSRNSLAGTHNYVVFDDRLVRVVSYDQKLRGELVIHHNLTEANLLHSVRMGGLAVPSFAITPSPQSITSYGEITLLGGKEMADPQGYARTHVFGADVYSPRYPTIHYTIDAAAEKRLQAVIKANPEAGASYYDLDELQKEGARYLKNNGAVMAQFLKDRGLALPASMPNTSKYARPGDIDQFQTRYEYESAIAKANLGAEFEAYALDLFESLQPTERIFKGFTNQGNRSYQAHTLENVVRILKRELRGGESESNIYGMGQLRAKFTPRFKSLAAIKKAANRIIAPAEFEAVKEEVEKEFFAIANALEPYYPSDKGFRYTDTVIAVLEDAPKGLNAALKDFGFEDVNDDIRRQIGTFLEKLKTLPTEYFEAKILREVDLAEFAGAVIPEDASPAVRAALEDRGVMVATYARGNNEARQAAVAQLADQLGDKVLFQDPEQRRGSIVFGADRKVTVNLFANADLSTFLHETGHFFLEVFGDLVDRLEATPAEQRTAEQQRMLADWTALLAQLGVASRADIAVEHHEHFARMFETYLMEGTAPSLELRSMFARTRAWLLGVYRALKALNAPLTDEVRGIFDRMLASEQAIAETKAAAQVEAMFTDATSAGMSEVDFALYKDAVRTANISAREDLDRKLMAEVQREQTAQWKSRREEIATQLEATLGGRPDYRAIAAMQFGTNPDGTPLVDGLETPPLKLSRAILVDRYGEGVLRTLPRPYVYSKDGGLDPDAVAQRFGYSSGAELIAAVSAVEPFRRAIERETNAQMIREHGSILLDGTLHEKAAAALSNEDREIILRKELRALAQLRRTAAPFVAAGQQATRAAVGAEGKERAYERRWLEAEAKLRIAIAEGHKQVEIDALKAEVQNLRQQARGGAATINAAIPPASTIKAAAVARVAGLTVRQLQPAVFWSASRKASQQATERAARQDFEGAIEAKSRELMNVAMFREASRAKDDVEQRVRDARDLARPKTLATLGDTYADQVAGILDRFNFAKVPQRMLDRRASLARFIAGLEGESINVEMPPELLEEHLRRDYKDLTYEELLGVTDGLQHIAHLARAKNRLLKIEAKKTLDTKAAELGDSIREQAKGARRVGARDRRPSEERHRMVEDWFAGHRKLASMLREMDGYQDGGPMTSAIMFSLNAAGDAEAEQNADATVRLQAIVDKAFPGKEKRTLYTKQVLPGLGQSLSKMERISIALNWGNETSRDRIRRSEGWDDATVQQILDTLTIGELTFVQEVFDYLETFRPAIGEKQKRVTGIEPTWVDAVAITAASGTIRGGYYPLKYDDRLSAGAIKNLDLDAANIARQAAYTAATTKRGHVQERVKTVKLKVRRDFGVLFEHVDQVIHDLTHHETLLDVGRLLSHKAVADAILETQGDVVFKQIRGALRDVAFGDIPAKGGFERALNHVRAGATVAGLGWNLTTAALQPLGLANSWQRIGGKAVVRGMYRWLRSARSMEDSHAWVTEKSPFMRARARTMQREVNEIRNSMNVSVGSFGGWMDEILEKATGDLVTRQGIGDSYFYLIGLMQRVADMPTWLGEYEKAMDAGETEERAIARADQSVLDSQGGGQIKDLSQVQRGGPMMRLWTNFYSFFNVLYNQATEAKRRTNFKDPYDVGRLAGDYLVLFVVPAVLGYALRELIRPGASGDDDDLGTTLVGEVAGYITGTMVGLREVSGLLQGYYGYEGPAGARFFSALARFGQQVRQGKADAAARRATIDVTGSLLHLPAGQINKSLDGITALEEGKTDNPLAVLTGAPKRGQ